MILVDTSVLINYLKGKETAATAFLASLEESETPFAIPLMCLQEVLQGARDEREWKHLHDLLITQQLTTPSDSEGCHIEAARIFFDCRRKGLTVQSTVDCLIAAQALQSGATLLHDDDDYARIARVRPLRAIRGK